jgi:hypothetical protein
MFIPWIVYISLTLPTRHLSRHWDLSWGGLDVAIFLSLLLTGIFASIRSRWIVISSATVSTLLIVDAWFDIVTQKPGTELREAIVLAVFFEIPMAIVSLIIAIRVLDHNID